MCLADTVTTTSPRAPTKRKRPSKTAQTQPPANSAAKRAHKSPQEAFGHDSVEEPCIQEAPLWTQEVSHSHLSRLELCRSVSEELKVFFQRDPVNDLELEEEVTLKSILARCCSPVSSVVAGAARKQRESTPATTVLPMSGAGEALVPQLLESRPRGPLITWNESSRDELKWTTEVSVRSFNIDETIPDTLVADMDDADIDIDVALFCMKCLDVSAEDSEMPLEDSNPFDPSSPIFEDLVPASWDFEQNRLQIGE